MSVVEYFKDKDEVLYIGQGKTQVNLLLQCLLDKSLIAEFKQICISQNTININRLFRQIGYFSYKEGSNKYYINLDEEYEWLSKYIVSIIYQKGVPEIDVYDIASTVILVLSKTKIDKNGNLKSFIYTVTVNTVNKYFRSRKKEHSDKKKNDALINTKYYFDYSKVESTDEEIKKYKKVIDEVFSKRSIKSKRIWDDITRGISCDHIAQKYNTTVNNVYQYKNSFKESFIKLSNKYNIEFKDIFYYYRSKLN